MNYSDFFIAVYTHSCKKYCDVEFFDSLLSSDIGDATIEIVDNSIGNKYTKKLKLLTGKDVRHISVSRSDPETQFLRNVSESVNYLRDLFLKSECKYFVILESDVIPPKDWLNYFNEVIDKGDIIGGIYYEGFHGQDMFDYDNIIQVIPTVLSGCTLYKREIIERFPFRWSPDTKAAFPDGWISFDARNTGFRLINYSKNSCKHLTKQNSDSRGLEDIN